MKNNIILMAALFIGLLAPVSCSQVENEVNTKDRNADKITGEYKFKMYDSTYNEICTGILSIDMDSVDVRGSIKTDTILNNNMGLPERISGVITGKYYSATKTLSINTDPGITDNNIFINIKALNNSLLGMWTHETMMGTQSKGKFEAEKITK